jgi:WD40 repeat protein
MVVGSQLLASTARSTYGIRRPVARCSSFGGATNNPPHEDKPSLAVAQDGSWIAANYGNDKLWFWDTATGRLLAGPDTEPADDRYARALDPSGSGIVPLGQAFASEMIGIWDRSSERLRKYMLVGRDIEHCLALLASGDGRWLIYQGGLALDFWRVDGSRSDHDRPFHGTASIDYHYAGKRVGQHRFAVTGRKKSHSHILQMWELSDVPKLLWQTDFPPDCYSPLLTPSPTGHWLACEFGSNIEVRDAATGKLLHSYPAHSVDVYASALNASPDGRALAAAYSDSSVALFDLATDTYRYSMPGHRRSLNALEMAADGRWLAAAGADGTVRLWDPATGSRIESFNGLPDAKQDGVSAMAASHDGTWLATVYRLKFSIKKSVIIRNVRTREQRSAIQMSAYVRLGERLAWTPDGRHLVFWDSDTSAYLFDSQFAGGPSQRTLAVLGFGLARNPWQAHRHLCSQLKHRQSALRTSGVSGRGQLACGPSKRTLAVLGRSAGSAPHHIDKLGSAPQAGHPGVAPWLRSGGLSAGPTAANSGGHDAGGASSWSASQTR